MCGIALRNTFTLKPSRMFIKNIVSTVIGNNNNEKKMKFFPPFFLFVSLFVFFNVVYNFAYWSLLVCIYGIGTVYNTYLINT